MKKLEEYERDDVPEEIMNHPFIQQFAQEMMKLSNRLNTIDDNDNFADDLDIKDDYLPKIRKFINITTGL
ncbi:MAG: hypothetical protein ACOCVA_00965 [Prolixibacteraceae bacterium]